MNHLRTIYYNWLAKKLIAKYGYQREKYEDRDTLERIIFPYVLANLRPQKVLDIGREDYQKFYNKFFKRQELWTIDKDVKRQEFGAKNHITDDAANLKKYFDNNYFDFILMNGVFGWGLDKKAQVEKAFQAIYDILAPGGIFILGWNDDIVPLSEIKALNKLKPYSFKPLNGTKFECINGDHTYNFYTKK
jgi:SAM-dependent methyltransferase